MGNIDIASVILILSLILAPLGLTTIAAPSDAHGPLLGRSHGPWSAARCAHPNAWAIEGLIDRANSCTCLLVLPLGCGSEAQVPPNSVEPPRSPLYDVEL